jgi:hypothetical protein
MRLLEAYLAAVGLYLHGHHRKDILRELEENLRSQIDERESDLERPLTDAELQSLLLAHGTPLAVAARYGSPQGTLTFGRQLIGPEFFPIYLRVLMANWIISAVIHGGIALSPIDLDEPRPFLTAALVQFVVVTIIFCVVDLLQRRSGGVPPSLVDPGRFPPIYMREIPRWQMRAGFVCWLVVCVWWALIPSYPMLLIGTASRFVVLSPAWDTFYWPILLLLLAGLAQRAANYVRPDWNWLLPVVRLTINTIGLALIYPIHRSYPYFQAARFESLGADAVARGLDTATWWAVVAGFSLFLLSQVAVNGWMWVQHVRFLIRQREERAS